MTRFIIAALFVCFFSPLTQVCAGNVKTIDGNKMPKDSVATIYLCEQIGKRFADSVLFGYVVMIDSVSVAQLLHGEADDYGWAVGLETRLDNVDFAKAYAEFGDAYQLRKVFAGTGKHNLILRCGARFTGRNEQVFITLPFRMEIDVLAEHTYGIRIRYSRPDWSISIEDKTAKKVAASIIVTPKTQ